MKQRTQAGPYKMGRAVEDQDGGTDQDDNP